MSMERYEQYVQAALAPGVSPNDQAAYLDRAGAAMVEAMSAPNDTSVYERCKLIGGSLLVIAHNPAQTLMGRLGLLHGSGGGNHLQFGILLGAQPSFRDSDVRAVLGQAATYIQGHDLARSHPAIRAHTFYQMARFATQYGFAGAMLSEGQLPPDILRGMEAEYAAYTQLGQEGTPMGPAYGLEQPTQQFVDRYLPQQ